MIAQSKKTLIIWFKPNVSSDPIYAFFVHFLNFVKNPKIRQFSERFFHSLIKGEVYLNNPIHKYKS